MLRLAWKAALIQVLLLDTLAVVILILGIVTYTVVFSAVVIKAVLPDIQTEAIQKTVTLYAWKE